MNYATFLYFKLLDRCTVVFWNEQLNVIYTVQCNKLIDLPNLYNIGPLY
jgi:hypothetical protein